MQRFSDFSIAGGVRVDHIVFGGRPLLGFIITPRFHLPSRRKRASASLGLGAPTRTTGMLCSCASAIMALTLSFI